ncbi:transporter substrate-binding domain-containing protein [Gemmiger sp.]
MKLSAKLTALTLTAAMAASLAACGSSTSSAPAAESTAAPADTAATTEAADGDLLSQIKERGTITIAMEGTWAPWTYHDENDNLVGYDVEVGTKIAEKLGVEPQFIEGEWDGLLAGLDAGRYDIMVNGVDITPERSEKYDFSIPYAYNRTAVITKADNDSINTLEDLNGKTTANTISSTYAELAEKYGATVKAVDDLNQTFELLLSGRIDATLNAEVTFYDYTKEHPDANVKIAVLTDDANEVAIPLRKSDDTATLREAINAAIEEMRADGTLKALIEKYFGVDISANN